MFTLNDVVPWGRSFDEYRRMFALSDRDLQTTILGVGDGPASFNAEAASAGLRVMSCDPIYRFDAAQIQLRIDATSSEVLEQTRRNADEFVWTDIRDVEELRVVRLAAMQRFLADYPSGRMQGRYVDASLPELPFDTQAFDLALCSHFLFLYSDQLGNDFHRLAVRELARVAREVRIFPLLALGGRPSALIEPVMTDLRGLGWQLSIERVPYEFQRGGNRMLRIEPGTPVRP